MKKEKENNSNPNTYTIIPDALLEKETLTSNAKIILGKILNLSRSCKEVKISNARLSQLICADIRTVQRAKKELVKQGLIKIVQEEKGRGNLATIQVNKEKVNEFLGFNYFIPEKTETPTPAYEDKGEDYYSQRAIEMIMILNR